MTTISGKVLFITGASSGIGKETVRQALQAGAKVCTLSRSVIKDPQEAFGSTDGLYLQGDASKEEDVIKAFEKCVATFGTVDILLNNAGLGIPTPDLSDVDLDTFQKMFDINAQGVFLCTREALKIMKPKKSGQILTIISMAGIRANPGAPLYCASKFAARGYMDGLAQQVSKDGIRITDINPGPVDTNYWGDRQVPREKFLQPSEVANIILFVLNLPEHIVMREVNFDSLAWLGK